MSGVPLSQATVAKQQADFRQTIGEDSSTVRVRQRTTAPHAQLATTLALIAELRNVDSHSVLTASVRIRQTTSK